MSKIPLNDIPSPASLGPWTVLYIEDNENDYLLLRHLIEGIENVRVSLVWKNNYKDGLETLLTGVHDACFLDYRLGKDNGIDLVRTAVSKGCTVPLVLLTAEGQTEVDVEAINAGAADYLVKEQLTPMLIERTLRHALQRKQAEERLKKRERQLAEAQALALLGSYDWDLVTGQFEWSDEMYLVYGLTPGVFTPSLEAVRALVLPEDRAAIETAIAKATAGNRIFDLHYRVKSPNEGVKYIHARGEVTLGPNNRPARIVGTAQDITAQRNAEEVLRQREDELYEARKLEAIGRLAGGVAHDFNNLLTGILGLSEEIKRRMASDDPNAEEVDEIIKAANRAFAVTKQLLAFSRRQVVQPKIFDINTTVTDVTKLLHRLIGEDITLQIDLQPVHLILADPGHFEQILLNLSINSRDAMTQGGVITIRTKNVALKQEDLRLHAGAQSGSYVLLEVSDTGSGMDEETLSHIFEPFFTTKERGKGTGLGLATVYGIVKQNNGIIAVESKVGGGTTFKVYFPAQEAASPTAKVPEQKEGQEGKETILVVEDEGIVRRVVCRRLVQKGYKVLSADNGAEALRVAEEHKGAIDLILVDVIMPGMNGRQVVEALRRKSPEVTALYMSGYPEDVITSRGVLEPGINFIDKTSVVNDLTSTVRKLLDKRH